MEIVDSHTLRLKTAVPYPLMPSDLASEYLNRTFQIVQPDFKKIGVQLNLKVLDPSAAYDAITANNYRNFELSMWDWFPLTDPDFMLSLARGLTVIRAFTESRRHLTISQISQKTGMR